MLDPTTVDPTQDDSMQPPPMQSVMPSSPTPLPASVTNPPAPTPPTLAPNSSGQPSLWKQVLAGALSGIAGSAGSTSFGGGLAKGVGAELQAQQQAKQDAAAQQQQMSADKVQQLQLAKAQIDLMTAHRQLSLLPPDARTKVLNDRIASNDGLEKAGALVPVAATTDDYASTLGNINKLHSADPSKFYSAEPVHGDDGGIAWQAVYHPSTPTQADVTINNPDGSQQTVKAGSMSGSQVAALTNKAALAQIQAATPTNEATTNLKNRQASVVQQNANANTARANNSIKGEDPVVAVGPDGSNIVTTRGEADSKGMFHYKVDPSKINATVAGFNDVQTKVNRMANLDYDNVQPGIAGALIDKGISAGIGGINVPVGRVNALLNDESVGKASQATKDFVVAYLGAHEAMTQLPRLQTFGQSSRMTEQQMEAAQAQLPKPGDGSAFSKQKLAAVQDILDPLRKQVPKMPGAALIPTYRDGSN